MASIFTCFRPSKTTRLLSSCVQGTWRPQVETPPKVHLYIKGKGVQTPGKKYLPAPLASFKAFLGFKSRVRGPGGAGRAWMMSFWENINPDSSLFPELQNHLLLVVNCIRCVIRVYPLCIFAFCLFGLQKNPNEPKCGMKSVVWESGFD